MRVALVYDRLNKVGGAERVLVALNDLYPKADWYTSVWDPQSAPFTRHWRVHHSFFSRIPWLRRHHEYLVLFMPFIFEAFDFSAYDLVISIGSAECKGIITKPSTLHLHYCLTPTRYLYSHATEYLKHRLTRLLAIPLRAWDHVAATRPDTMIAISTQVKNRINKYYQRESEIIFPPVDTARFRHSEPPGLLESLGLPSNYFLVVSRLVPYKRIDSVIRAFAKLPKANLVIVGVGSEAARLKDLATNNVYFLNQVKDSILPSIYQNAMAYIQLNEEDFGISMVEALASGIPVLAYGSGGALDIVKSGVTGILLRSNTTAALTAAIDNFDQKRFDKEACRRSAQRFDVIIWKQKMTERIKELL